MVGMTAALSVAPGLAGAELGEYRVGYISQDGMRHQVSLADAQAVRFEVMSPARRFAARKGQRHLPGLWWSSTVAGHVGYESWLERDHLIWLDWDRAVMGIASQPFWLSWTGPDGRDVAHAPDFFVRRTDGSAVVVDCRPAERRPAGDLAKFEATRRACGLVGWEYRLVGAPDPIVTANLRWLAGYRHPRHGSPELMAALRAAFAAPTLLMAGAEAVGDPIAVLPVLFHLLWQHELVTDLSVPLHPCAAVTRAAA